MNAEATEKIKQKCQESLLAFSVVTDRNFEPFWHHRVIADKLEQVERGEIKRLIISLGPRHGKSYLTTEKFPVWYLGKHPEREVGVVAYSAELAETFGYKSRDIAMGEQCRAIFNLKLRADSQAKDHWMTEQGGGYSAIGFGGSLTGRGFHLICIDDPVKSNEEAESQNFRDKQWTFYQATLYTRLYKDAAIVLIMTRWHMDDLAGRLQEEEKNGGDHWEVLNIPTIAEQDEEWTIKDKTYTRKTGDVIEEKLFSKQEILQKKNVLGSYYFSALYQGQPIPSGNQEFREEQFKEIELDEVLKMTTRRFMTIDTAISKKASGDYTGITLNFVNRENKWHIMTWKLRVSPQELMEFIFKTWKQYNVEQIGIEKTIYLMAVKPYFDEEMRKRNQFPYVTELAHNQINKEVRIRGLLPYYESGSIYHIKGRIDGLKEELLTFPKGRHDDVCLVGETLVLTQRGEIPIKDVVVGDLAMTRVGFKRVVASGMTGYEDVITVAGITGTKNHPIITKNGVKDLQYLNQSDTLYTWNEKLSCIEEKNFTDTQIHQENSTETTTGGILKVVCRQFRFIGTFMLKKLARYLTGIMSTIKMATRSIIQARTLNSSALVTTPHITVTSQRESHLLEKISKWLKKLPVSGMAHQMELHGTKNMQKIVSKGKNRKESVPNVLEYIKRPLKWLQNTVQKDAALKLTHECFGKKIQATTKKPVYNLTLHGEHEYFANRILVHNCDSLSYQTQIVKKPYDNGEKKVHLFKPTSFR